jgi:hypothetical protein
MDSERIYMKELRIGKRYFVCKSVNVLCKLMIKGFIPDITEKSKKHDDVWLWYFKTTDELLAALEEIFDDCVIRVMDNG